MGLKYSGDEILIGLKDWKISDALTMKFVGVVIKVIAFDTGNSSYLVRIMDSGFLLYIKQKVLEDADYFVMKVSKDVTLWRY